jgi:very-short-patch-repair endonuclease
VPAALERFLFDGTASRRAVDQALRRHARRGRPGITALRAALDAWDIDGRPPDSVLELKTAALLARHGLPAARFHARIRGFEVDFAIDAGRVIVECDGWDAHHRRGQFERDRARDAALSAAGWVVLRFTWSQITRREAWVASVIRSTIAHRAAA